MDFISFVFRVWAHWVLVSSIAGNQTIAKKRGKVTGVASENTAHIAAGEKP
jgi:hypothetical protein